jgi:hypothetical protein
LGLSGTGSDVKEKHRVNAFQRRSETLNVVEVSEGDIHSAGKGVSARWIAHEGSHGPPGRVKLFNERLSDVPGGSGDEVHG